MSLSQERIRKMRPVNDRVLVEKIEEKESLTAGGIVIPDQSKERAQIGKIIAVGSGKLLSDGRIHPVSLKVGDEIFFGKFSGTEIAEGFLLLKEDEVLGIL